MSIVYSHVSVFNRTMGKSMFMINWLNEWSVSDRENAMNVKRI